MEADPQNAASYRQNALAAEARIESLIKQVDRRLASRRDVVLIPYHDAFQYFLARFGFEIHGGIADHEGTAPGAARLAEIRAQLSNVPHGCVFSEPGANAALFEAAIPGAHIGRGELDPLGAAIQPGRDFYPALIESLADAIADCLPG